MKETTSIIKPIPTMSQVQPQAQDQPDSHDQSDAQDQPQIGDQTLALPRVIQIESICERDAQGMLHLHAVDDLDDDADNEPSYSSPIPCSPTPLLGICRESRSIVMKNDIGSHMLAETLYRNGTMSFCSVALDFAGIRANNEIAPWGGNIPQDISICWQYALSRMEVEKVYIVYSSGDCRDEVEQEVKYLLKHAKNIIRNRLVQDILKEKNERDGTNLTEWKIPTVEEILDTRLLNRVETFHNFPDLPLKLRRAIWKFAAIPHHRAIQIETKYEGITVESYGGCMAVWRNQMTSPCYPNALFETCRESCHIAITKYDHSKVHKISTQVTEECNIPRLIYYNVDNDIMWMRGDPLRKTTSAGVIRGILYNAPYDQFANIAIDVETLFSRNFPQGQESVFPTDLFRPTDLSRTLPFLEPFALKELYLVYSRADQKDLATEVLDQLLDHMKRNENNKKRTIQLDHEFKRFQHNIPNLSPFNPDKIPIFQLLLPFNTPELGFTPIFYF
ncbi:hypothetical protein BPAE_0045g00220 [Botrytis paeoniae]|uniref:2EXR domain-containing protein n=1 Tax=Botrytis paeoniae TaxID=278948 RepID=A0A4Z1FRT8_9HELO|nr:hypothetical protein BPAE_0045g00220 [Botrytis paeoniae]